MSATNQYAIQLPEPPTLVTLTAKQHTIGHLNCPACLEMRTVLLCTITPDMTFREASTLWLKSRAVAGTPGSITAHYIRQTTESSYRQYIESLNLFFGDMRLRNIEWVHYRAYQHARLNGDAPFIRYRRPQDAKERVGLDGTRLPAKGKTPCPAKPVKVNQELDILKRILRRVKVLTEDLEELFENLIVEEPDVVRAMTPAEQRTWLDISRLKDRWMVVHWYSVLAFETCMATNELRGLRIGDVDLQRRVITVPRKAAKNKYRSRTIPLVSADALWAAEQLLRRAADLGARDPQHYLFPTRSRNGAWDPRVPMGLSGIKRVWDEVRSASGIKWFRQYDCRHTAISRLAEVGTPVDVIMSMAGHISEKMRRHYTHVSEQSKIFYLQQAFERRFPQQPAYQTARA